METSPRALPSPTSHSSTSSSSSDNNHHHNINNSPLLHSLPSPKTPTISTRPESSSNPYPTTFVQADTTSFKQVVQMLTGTTTNTTKDSHSHSHNNNNNHIPPMRPSNKARPSKLYERRNSSLKALKMIHPLVSEARSRQAGGGVPYSPTENGFHSPHQYPMLSPSMLDFPALALSPVTPLLPDPFTRSPKMVLNEKAEEQAIKDKGFYLHPVSPVSTTPRDSEPRLLPLFPLTSPKASGS